MNKWKKHKRKKSPDSHCWKTWSCSRAVGNSPHLQERSVLGSTEKPVDSGPEGGNQVNKCGQICQSISLQMESYLLTKAPI